MNALQAIRSQRQSARELRLAAWHDICRVLADPAATDLAERQRLAATHEGYQRELEALATVELSLIGAGKPLPAETRSDAPEPTSALPSPSAETNEA